MKKEQLSKMQYAITFKKKNSRIPKGLVLGNQNKELDKERDSYESPSKNKFNFASDDGKSETNKSTKEKKSLPSLIPPSAVNPIRKIVAQKALVDYMKNLSGGSNYQDKETLHHQTLTLKQKNNELTVQNMKLKTRIMNLDAENARMTRMLQEEIEIKYPGTKESRLKSNELSLLSIKHQLKETKKQLNALKVENVKVMKTMKFTRISELEIERKMLQEQSLRLKELLQEEVAENLSYKMKSNNKSELQQQCISLQQANRALKKEVIEYSKKLRVAEEKGKLKPEAEKGYMKTINDLRRVVKERTVEVDNLRKGREEVKEERGIRSASLHKGKVGRVKCEECGVLKNEIKGLKEKVKELEEKMKAMSENAPLFEDIVIKQPQAVELEEVGNFLRYRFKAHHLSFDNLLKYLVKVEAPTISVGAMVQNLLVEPFFLIHPAYLQTMIAYLFYGDSTQPQIKANQQFQKEVPAVKELFLQLISPYDLTDTRKQQEIFIQITQIITQHCDHISTAFDAKRNGQGTISKSSLTEFLTYINLDPDSIEFIITQIVLESTDLQHLNYYSLFQIFYLPNTNFNTIPQAVKELDQQYQQSQQSGRIKGVQKLDTINIEEDQEYEQIFDEKEEIKSEQEIPQYNDQWG